MAPCSGSCSGAGGSGCSDEDINNGSCEGSKYACYDANGDGPTDFGWSALDWCENLELAVDGTGDKTDWRLPTQKELLQAYINGAANNLPNPDHYYWSSTEYYSSTAKAWLVYLSYGNTLNFINKTNSGYYARCVRR